MLRVVPSKDDRRLSYELLTFTFCLLSVLLIALDVNVWNAFSGMNHALCAHAYTISEAISRQVLPTTEKYIIIQYDRGNSENDVNHAR